MAADLPPGPAFIQATNSQIRVLAYLPHLRFPEIPDGYVWRPATIGTAAGWVRAAIKEENRW